MAASDELLLTLRQIGAYDIADGLENVADQLDNLEKSQEDVNKTGEKAVDANKNQKRSLLEVNAALDLAQKGMNVAKTVVGALGDAVDATVGKYADYSREVQLLSNNLGLSTEETSRLIQVADDYGVSTGEVTSALQMMVRRGVKPSIDELANLADEYRAIEDPVKRAELMTEKLGRGWTTLTPLLKEGGQAIRDAAANQSDALVITDEDVKLTEELRVAKDNLGDALDGVAMRVGKKVIPAFTGLVDTLGKVVQAADANMILLDETKSKTDRLAAAEWLLSEAKGFSKPLYQERVDTLKQEVAQLNKENEAVGLVTDKEILAARAKAELAVQTSNVAKMTASQVSGLQALALANQTGGPVQAEYNKWLHDEANAAAAAALSMKELTTQTIYNTAAAGLDANAALVLAEKMGLVDKGALGAAKAIEEQKRKLKDGQSTNDDYAASVIRIQDAIAGLKDKNVTITLETIQKEIRQQQNEQIKEEIGKLRAYGGAVSPGVPYVINEHLGGESFMPQQAGIVIPQSVYNDQRVTNITTDSMGVALAMARAQQMAAEARM